MISQGRKRGKEAERRVARRLGGRRLARHGLPAPDIEGDWFVAEVKDYLKAPKVPYRELRKLVSTTDPRKIRLFIFKRPEWHDYLVCCFLKEFTNWFGKVF